MAPTPAQPEPSASAAPALPPEGVRTLVSFLLFLHLFALSVGIIAAEGRTNLEQTILERIGLVHYLHALRMDLPYTYYFTRGMAPGGELDIDYTIEATIEQPDGKTAKVLLPASGLQPRQRYRRLQTLATEVARAASPDEGRAPEDLELLMQSIAGGLLAEYDVKKLDIRCVGRLTPPAMADFNPESYRPNYRNAYDAHAFLWGDQVELIRKEPARDTAPPPQDE